MPKTALVVDDSRVALMSLSRLLKPRGLHVDTAESGVEALDYLRMNPPPVAIFLDHMMPGMDGFETLAELKKDPRTAAVPVIMYTSVEADAYLETARALGAAGVLRKPAQADDLQRILVSLNLTSSNRTDEGVADREIARPVVSSGTEASSAEPTVPPPGRLRVAPSPVPITDEFRVETNSHAGWIALVLLLAVAALGGYYLYRQADAERELLLAENNQLVARAAEQAELARRAAADAEAMKAAIDVPNQVPTETARTDEPSRLVLNAITWALNQHAGYDFGSTPLNDERLRVLRELLPRLAEIGFRGTVRLDSHIGEFCVVRDEQGAYQVPPPNTPYTRCEVLRYLPADAVMLGQRQSDNFNRFLMQRALTKEPIDIVVASYGTTRPVRRYPINVVPTTAGDWNAVARANQRVEFVLVPRPK